ncbi:hypothetical protein, partial [Jatrophihabitans endophyticus]|uniref:hypothetical protein n=1 Tax=Jatrophihabitans endophyticus TaxID=1206085 RepID=UPI001A0E0F52
GVAAQLGLATKQSPWHARRWLGWGTTLTAELPQTFAELRAGRTTEWRALLVARETVWLSRADRAEVDERLAPQLEALGDRQVEHTARAHAQRLDPAGAAERRRIAERERRVTLRPLPDTMTSLSATNTVARGVEMYARLRRDADALVGTGESGGRTRDQVMADLLYQRVTGRDSASGPAVEVDLLVSAESLLGTNQGNRGRDDSALLGAEGVVPVPVPAGLAREIVADSSRAWVRRLFTAPATGELIAMESRRRLFTDAQRRFIRARDQVCSTPYCGAAIRHIDHARPAELGGPTAERNGNGKCVACNIAKQARGWRQSPLLGGRATITTPTGHVYSSRPPRPPGTGPQPDPLPDVVWHLMHDAA